MKNVPTPSCGLPSWVLRFSCCCCAFRLSGTFRLSPVYLLGVGHYDFQPGFSVGDHSSGSRGDGDRHVRLFGDLQRRNRCRGTRRRIRLYARFDCPDRLCRGYDRIVGGALLLGAVGAVIEKEPGLISNEEPETPAIGEVAGRCVFRGADRSGRISGASWSGAIQPVASRSDRGA